MTSPVQNLKAGVKTSEFWLCVGLTGWMAFQSSPTGADWKVQVTHYLTTLAPVLFYTHRRLALKLKQFDIDEDGDEGA